MSRAESSDITLNESDTALVKGMLARGDRQHDIAAYFGVNSGRVADIAKGRKFPSVRAAASENLPAPGPYVNEQNTRNALAALAKAQEALLAAASALRVHGVSGPN
jgi:hypothetical protein